MQKNGISTYSDKKISVGDIRKTQLITTYGVGAIVDFKNDTVVIASTDDWDYSPNDAGEVENRKKFSFFKELHQLFGFFFCDMSCYIFRYLAVFIQQLYAAAKRLQISAPHCIQRSDFHLSNFFFPKKTNQTEYPPRLLQE